MLLKDMGKNKSYWEFQLEIPKIFLIAIILAYILVFIDRKDLYFLMFIFIIIFIFITFIRRFVFYEDKLIIFFLYRKITILYKNIDKVIYRYRAAGADVPTIIIKLKYKKENIFEIIFRVLFLRFLLRKEKNIASLLKFLENKNISVEFKTAPGIKERILAKMGKDI